MKGFFVAVILYILLMFTMPVSATSSFVDVFDDGSLSGNWTVYYTSGAWVENGAMYLGTSVGKGAGWTNSSFGGGNQTIEFDYIDLDYNTTGTVGVYLNGSGTSTSAGYYVKFADGGTNIFYYPNGTAITFETAAVPSPTAHVKMTMDTTFLEAWVGDIRIGNISADFGTGYLEFRQKTASGLSAIDNLTVNETFVPYVAGSESGGGEVSSGTRYVSHTGSNANNGTSVESAWANPLYALENAGENETVYILNDGIYYEDIDNYGSYATQNYNNVTIDSYDGSQVMIFGPNASDYGLKRIFYSGNKKLTLRNVIFSRFGGGILGVGDNSTIDSIHMYNFSGLVPSGAAMLDMGKGGTISSGSNQIWSNITLNDTAMPTPSYPEGSSSPNMININGAEDDDAIPIVENILLTDFHLYGRLKHVAVNVLACNMYTDSGQNCTGVPGLKNVEVSNGEIGPMTFDDGYTTAIAIIYGVADRMYIHDVYIHDTYRGIVGIFSNSTIANITLADTGTAQSVELQSRTNEAGVLTGVTTYSTDVLITDCNGTNTGGVWVQGGKNITFQNSYFSRYSLDNGPNISEIKILNPLPMPFNLETLTTTEVDVTYTNGRLFIENFPQTIVANATGTHLPISDTYASSSTITPIGYGLIPETTMYATNVSAGGVSLTSVGENVTFYEFASGNSSILYLESGTTFVPFASIDFTSGETELPSPDPFTISEHVPVDLNYNIAFGQTPTFSATTNEISNHYWYKNGSLEQTNLSVWSSSYGIPGIEKGSYNITVIAEELG